MGRMKEEDGTAYPCASRRIASSNIGVLTCVLDGQFVIQEIIGLAQYLADKVPADKLETITLYTWHKDSLHVLMDFVRTFRYEFITNCSFNSFPNGS